MNGNAGMPAAGPQQFHRIVDEAGQHTALTPRRILAPKVKEALQLGFEQRKLAQRHYQWLTVDITGLLIEYQLYCQASTRQAIPQLMCQACADLPQQAQT